MVLVYILEETSPAWAVEPRFHISYLNSLTKLCHSKTQGNEPG